MKKSGAAGTRRDQGADRSAVALPFWMKDQQIGVFFLRTTGDDPPLTRADAQFAETVIKTAVSAIEKAYDFESAVSDKQRLEKLAATDALTGLTNRRGLSEALTQELDRARRYNLALTILLADIDRFKTINDTAATSRATPCCARSASSCGVKPARWTSWRATVARSSSS